MRRRSGPGPEAVEHRPRVRAGAAVARRLEVGLDPARGLGLELGQRGGDVRLGRLPLAQARQRPLGLPPAPPPTGS
ncbi:hypothetical protein SR39_08460 [Methylobacterium radiotolerans]|nr:hypothetical protein SR39_08460 [Methylobacterium radiotolerans]